MSSPIYQIMDYDLFSFEMEESDGEIDGGNFFESLPEGFIAKALGRTSPRDACRLSLVCSVFRSAAEWDVVWEQFLPPDYQNILAASQDGDRLLTLASKKELYLSLCDHPVIIDGGKKSFWLHKLTGKKNYMLAARDLLIIWGDTPRYWRWISVPDSRFAEVAELISVCWLEIRGRIDASLLSSDTLYGAYLVYKTAPHTYGFEYNAVEASVRLTGVENESESELKAVFLNPEGRQPILPGMRQRRPGSRWINAARCREGPKRRQDGWLEIELGKFCNRKGEGEVEMSVMEVKGGNWKAGLIIQGIEIRPTSFF